MIKELYFHRDKERSVEATLLWLGEEVGELFQAYRRGDKKALQEELADVLAWVASFANVMDIDLEEALKRKYPGKCYYCNSMPCRCEEQKIF